jgi:thymidylate synthase
MKYLTTSEAYQGVLDRVLNNPDYYSAPRGIPVYEVMNLVYTVENPSDQAIITKDLERNKVIASYTEKEKVWYDSGNTSVESAIQISKFWGKLANPDGTVNSNYGYLIFYDKSEGDTRYEKVLRTPWEWCVNALKTDINTRQAVLRINKSKHLWNGNKDVVCTLHGIFSVRNNQVNLTIVQRSLDCVTGLVYDMPFFCSLIPKMVDSLKSSYPDLKIGKFTHIVHNAHIYEKDLEKVKKMLGYS